MWTTSTVGGKVFLSVLAVWFILILSDGRSSAADVVTLSCCTEGSNAIKGDIIACFKQKPRGNCPKTFYVVVIEGGTFCINPHSKWLQWKMKKENLKCPLPKMH